jgi:predicted naringenin-chalcone synthase
MAIRTENIRGRFKQKFLIVIDTLSLYFLVPIRFNKQLMTSEFTPIIRHFQIVRPRFILKQSASLDWLAKAHSIATKKPPESMETLHLKRRYSHYGCSEKRISERGTEIEDFTHKNWVKMNFFNLAHENENKLNSKMEFYNASVNRTFEELFDQKSSQKKIPEYLIHVSCTGYISPSPAQRFLDKKKWGHICGVLHLYHMGCYASLPAIKVGKALVRDSGKNTTIVHNELCTLHFNPWDSTPQQLVIQSLFSDGHIKYNVEKKGGQDFKSPGLEILSLKEFIIPESTDDMGWTCSELNFTMNLSPHVPSKLKKHILPFLKEWLIDEDLNWEKIQNEAFFAIHPGGPRIIDNIQEELKLKTWQISHSSRVLYRFGNMSSATLPHIWEKMLNSDEVPNHSLILSLAFGPGLSLHASLFKKTQ